MGKASSLWAVIRFLFGEKTLSRGLGGLGLDPTFVFHNRAISQASDSSSVKEACVYVTRKTHILYSIYCEYFDHGGRSLEDCVLAIVIGKYLNQS